MLERFFRTFVKLFWDEYNNSSAKITLEILILLFAAVVYCFSGVNILLSFIVQVLTFALLIFARNMTVNGEEAKEEKVTKNTLNHGSYTILFCTFIFLLFSFIIPYLILDVKVTPLSFIVLSMPQMLLFYGFSSNLYKYFKD